MRDRQNSAKNAFGFMGLVGVLTGAVMAMSGVASAAETYTFGGLRWGSTPKEATTTLRKKGFRVVRTVKGPRRELVEDGAWGKFVRKDRGKRMIARGKVGGMRTDVELVFGRNERLQRVIVKWPNWNGTISHAKRLTTTATKVTRQLESQHGRASERRNPFGWIDTARWQSASDGSGMELIIRGTNGMMFYPGDRTGVRLHFWNAKYGGKGGRSPQTAGRGSVPQFGPGRTQEIKKSSPPSTSVPGTNSYESFGGDR